MQSFQHVSLVLIASMLQGRVDRPSAIVEDAASFCFLHVGLVFLQGREKCIAMAKMAMPTWDEGNAPIRPWE